MTTNAEPLPDPDDTVDALTLRRPDVPITLTDLAARKGEALEIIDARYKVLSTLRVQAIRATHPEDWLLFKAPDEQGGQVVGYLQDAGCDRVRDLFGIEVFDISRPEKIQGAEPGHFMYLIVGSGRCRLTGQVVEAMEGGRSSTDDFCKDKTGADLELAVRKAARANLDGNVTRELAGMKAVPDHELGRAWEGTAKTLDTCRKGRGFGSRSERVGGMAANAPPVKPPVCGVCGTAGRYIPAKDGRPAFYGCPNYANHKDRKWTVNADTWIQQQTPKPAAPAPPAAAAAASNGVKATSDRPCEICGKPPGDHANADHDYDGGGPR